MAFSQGTRYRQPLAWAVHSWLQQRIALLDVVFIYVKYAFKTT